MIQVSVFELDTIFYACLLKLDNFFQVHAIERTPSMSELNEILIGQVFMIYLS